MTEFIARSLLILSIALVITGCKIEIIVPSGGNVVSSNTAHNCAQGSVCEVKVTAGQLPFTESFTAQPGAGYEFEKWSDGEGFQCAKSTNPTCTIAIADSALGSAAVELFDSIYLMPVFKDVGVDTDGDGVRNELDEDDDGDGIPDIEDSCPLDPHLSCFGDSISVNGQLWYQPDLFIGVSREEINAVCSEGLCDGVLNGHIMTGWEWATSQDVLDLLGHYGTMNPDEDCPAISSFFQDGWRETNTNFFYILRVAGLAEDGVVYISPDVAPCNYGIVPFQPSGDELLGAFFFRPNP